MTFYENFSALCKKHNIKPSRVAEECGINRSNVSNWKKNGYTPRADDLKKIANYFHVPVGYLLQTEAEREYSSGYGFYPPEFFWEKINNDRARFMHYFLWGSPEDIDEVENLWNIPVEHPESVSDETFKRFVEGTVRLLSFNPEEGSWEIRPKENKKKLPEGFELIDLSKYHRIPILGAIAAGLPIYAEENIEGYTLTDLNHGGEYFALRVKGDSMNAAQIMDGGLVIVRRQEEVENGEVAVVIVDQENATVKRFYQTETTVTLMPQSTNPEHRPQIYDLAQTKITVLGKVVKAEITVT